MRARPNFALVSKLALAFVAIVALALLPARQLAPGVPLQLLVLYVAGGVLLALVVIVALAVCWLQFAQFILRKGGTDPQWLWFYREPRGLEELRDRQDAAR